MPLPPELIVTVESQRRPAGRPIPGRDQPGQRRGGVSQPLSLPARPAGRLRAAVDAGEGCPAPRRRGDRARAGRRHVVGGSGAKLADYGRRLYGLLFGDGVKLAAFLEYNDAYRSQARLTLALHGNAAALWRLPWEYLHDERDFLALTGRLLLSRTPLRPGPDSPRRRSRRRCVSSSWSPRPMTSGRWTPRRRSASSSGRSTRRSAPAASQVEYLDDATLPAIGDTLRRFRPHVLHYTGHGVLRQGQRRPASWRWRTTTAAPGPTGIADLRPLPASMTPTCGWRSSPAARPRRRATWMRSRGSPPACWPRRCPRCWRCSTRSSTSRASLWRPRSTPRSPRAPARSRRPSASAWPCGRIGRARATIGASPRSTSARRRCGS